MIIKVVRIFAIDGMASIRAGPPSTARVGKRGIQQEKRGLDKAPLSTLVARSDVAETRIHGRGFEPTGDVLTQRLDTAAQNRASALVSSEGAAPRHAPAGE